MRIDPLLVALFVGLAGTAFVPTIPAEAARVDSRQEVAAAIDRWAEARIKGDTIFLERFYGPELRIGQMNGGLVDRKEDIALFAAGLIRPETISDTDLDVHVYGATAVVNLIEHLKGSYRGRTGELSLRMLNVLVRRDGRWQLVASQSTPIQAPR